MIDIYIGGWLAMTGAYLSATLSLLAGEVNALTVVATAGIVLLVPVTQTLPPASQVPDIWTLT
jgi:hypothetical protein